MGYIVQNTETKKYLAERKGFMNLTVAKPELATIYESKVQAEKEASNFDPYVLIEVE